MISFYIKTFKKIKSLHTGNILCLTNKITIIDRLICVYNDTS